MTVGGVAAHLTMATKALVGVLEERPLTGALADAATGPPQERRAVDFVTASRPESPAELETPVARWVQDKAAADAARGPAVVLERYDRGVLQAAEVLEHAPPERVVLVPVNIVMTVEDYVATRLVEVVVHCDDLAASLGPEPPPLRPEAVAYVADLLWASVRQRAGDAVVVRAMSRSERAAPDVLRAM
jgi:hypothetical protein